VSCGEAAMLLDNVDGDLLLKAQDLWSDMIVFTSLTPSKMQLISVQPIGQLVGDVACR